VCGFLYININTHVHTDRHTTAYHKGAVTAELGISVWTGRWEATGLIDPPVNWPTGFRVGESAEFECCTTLHSVEFKTWDSVIF